MSENPKDTIGIELADDEFVTEDTFAEIEDGRGNDDDEGGENNE